MPILFLKYVCFINYKFSHYGKITNQQAGNAGGYPELFGRQYFGME
jgi:hypothetical protein